MDIIIDQTTVDEIAEELCQGFDKNFIIEGYLIGKSNNGTVYIEGVVVPRQTSTVMGTLVSSDQRTEAIKAANDSGKTVVGLATYFAGQTPYENGVMNFSRRILLQQGAEVNLGLVVNKEGEYAVFQGH